MQGLPEEIVESTVLGVDVAIIHIKHQCVRGVRQTLLSIGEQEDQLLLVIHSAVEPQIVNKLKENQCDHSVAAYHEQIEPSNSFIDFN